MEKLITELNKRPLDDQVFEDYTIGDALAWAEEALANAEPNIDYIRFEWF